MTNMKRLYKPLRIRIGNINPLLFINSIRVGLLCSILFFSLHATAEEKYYSRNNTLGIDRFYIYTSIFTQHVSPEDEHVNDQNMFGVELRMTNKWMYGFTKFNNSFGQESEYLYAGYKWGILNSARYRDGYQYFKLTGGLLHGYRDEYEDKIPLNELGVAPAIIPTYGYQSKKLNLITEVSLGGASVIVVTFGYIF
jgi:hypothetical protein